MFTAKGSKLLFGALFVVVGAIAAAVVAAQRRRAAERRLREVDQGQRCIACDGTHVSRTGDAVTCGSCGHVASLSWLRRASPSQQELNTMYQPDDWHTPDP